MPLILNPLARTTPRTRAELQAKGLSLADETARRYLFVAIDRATHRVYLRIYADQSETSSTDFVRQLHAAVPMKIEKLLTDNGSQFTDRFTS